MFGDYHSLGAKSFAGASIDNSPWPERGARRSSTRLAGGNQGGYRTTTWCTAMSTPRSWPADSSSASPPPIPPPPTCASRRRETPVHLGETLKAILLDPGRAAGSERTAGLKKSPLEGYYLPRTLGAYTYLPCKTLPARRPMIRPATSTRPVPGKLRLPGSTTRSPRAHALHEFGRHDNIRYTRLADGPLPAIDRVQLLPVRLQSERHGAAAGLVAEYSSPMSRMHTTSIISVSSAPPAAPTPTN